MILLIDPDKMRTLWKCLGCGNRVYAPESADASTATQIAFEENGGDCCSGYSYERQLDQRPLYSTYSIVELIDEEIGEIDSASVPVDMMKKSALNTLKSRVRDLERKTETDTDE